MKDLRIAREELIEAAHRLVESRDVRSVAAVPDAIEILSRALDEYRVTERETSDAEMRARATAEGKVGYVSLGSGGRCRFEYPAGKCERGDGHAPDCTVNGLTQHRRDAFDDRPRRPDTSRTAYGVTRELLNRAEVRCRLEDPTGNPSPSQYIAHFAIALGEIIVEEREEAIRRAIEP